MHQNFVLFFLLLTGSNASASVCYDYFARSFSHVKIPQKALEHLFHGETHFDPGTGLHQLRGGLHTWPAAVEFLKKNPRIKHLDIERTTNDALWFQQQTVENGVMYLRLPYRAYTKKAQRDSWYSDLDHGGGYLWKTLFPSTMTKAQVYQAIRSVLNHPQVIEQGRWSLNFKGIVEHGGNSIIVRVIVDPKTNEVITAFPTFNQLSYGSKSLTPVGRLSILTDYSITGLPSSHAFQNRERPIPCPR